MNRTHHAFLSLFKNSSLDLSTTITSTLNNGGAVTFQLQDALEFIVYKRLSNEIEFLEHLFRTNSLTQDSIECFFKQMMFAKETARSFVEWQRKKIIL